MLLNIIITFIIVGIPFICGLIKMFYFTDVFNTYFEDFLYGFAFVVLFYSIIFFTIKIYQIVNADISPIIRSIF